MPAKSAVNTHIPILTSHPSSLFVLIILEMLLKPLVVPIQSTPIIHQTGKSLKSPLNPSSPFHPADYFASTHCSLDHRRTVFHLSRIALQFLNSFRSSLCLADKSRKIIRSEHLHRCSTQLLESQSPVQNNYCGSILLPIVSELQHG